MSDEEQNLRSRLADSVEREMKLRTLLDQAAVALVGCCRRLPTNDPARERAMVWMVSNELIPDVVRESF